MPHLNFISGNTCTHPCNLIENCFSSGDPNCLTLHSSLQSNVLLGLSVYSCNPSHCQGGGRRVNQLGQTDPVSKSNYSKKGLEAVFSGRAHV